MSQPPWEVPNNGGGESENSLGRPDSIHNLSSQDEKRDGKQHKAVRSHDDLLNHNPWIDACKQKVDEGRDHEAEDHRGTQAEKDGQGKKEDEKQHLYLSARLL
jgi:hypothetical protein